MYILTEDLEIVPEQMYDSKIYGFVISSHDTFQEAQEAKEQELENMRII